MALDVGKIEVGSERGSLLSILSPGKRTRLRRLLYEFGPGNGTLLFSIDQGIEHGPRDFFPNPASKGPSTSSGSRRGGYSAIACGYGMASKYYPVRRPGPAAAEAELEDRHPAGRRGAVSLQRIGRGRGAARADAVGYTLYVGSPKQEEDFIQLGKVRADCDRFGMPLVIWAYPRGREIEKKAAASPSLRSTTPPASRWRWARMS